MDFAVKSIGMKTGFQKVEKSTKSDSNSSPALLEKAPEATLTASVPQDNPTLGDALADIGTRISARV